MPTTTGIATEFIQFTRTSNATVTDSDGFVKWAPHNLLLASESFDAASWAKSSVTSTANSIAAPNGTTTADTLAASGANGTTLQTFTAEAISYTFGVWLKRKTGTGNIQIAADSGTYTTVTITSDWALYTVTQTPTAGSKTAGIRIVTSADEVYAWGASLYRSDLAMQPNTSAYPLYNPTTPKNVLGYTEDFSNAAWVKSSLLAFGSGSVANAAIAPNGLQTADLLVPNTTSTYHATYVLSALAAGVSYTASLYAKAGGYDKVVISDWNEATSLATFDLTNVTATLSGSGATVTLSNAAITSVGNEWYRCSVQITKSTSGQLAYFINSAVAYAGDGTSGIYLWGAQLSDSASLDTYVPVYGAAVTSAAYYGPRRDFDGATLACKGLLVEEQRTNLQLNSNVFGTSTFAATVVAGAAASPSGLIDASSLACTSVGGRAILSTSVTSGIVYTFSVFIKSGTNTSAFIELAGTAGSGGAVVFNLSSGTVTSGTGGAIVPAPNGFYRCSVTSTATGTGASDMRIGTGDATSKTVFVYGAQLEANASFATSYIPTPTAATATRLADVARVSTQAFPYSASESTIVASASPIGPGGSAAGSAVFSLKGASGNGLLLYQPATTYSLVAYVDASNVTLGTSSFGAIEKLAIAYNGVSNGAVRNGGTVSSVGTTVATAADSFYFGNIAAAYVFNGHIRQITYLPRRISNAELITRTS